MPKGYMEKWSIECNLSNPKQWLYSNIRKRHSWLHAVRLAVKASLGTRVFALHHQWHSHLQASQGLKIWFWSNFARNWCKRIADVCIAVGIDEDLPSLWSFPKDMAELHNETQLLRSPSICLLHFREWWQGKLQSKEQRCSCLSQACASVRRTT